MNIVIKELYDSDDILDLTEKINFNFDQLILGGGGPIGPSGATGSQGVAGPKGIRGSQWVAGFGATTINLPTDGVYRENDFKLNTNGDVDYYDGGFTATGINLTGPTGPQGPTGGGGITIIPGTPILGEWVATPAELQAYLSITDPNDADDGKAFGSPYINSGTDFVAMGRGNNSVVLGRYANIFDTGAAGDTYQPPYKNGVSGTRNTLLDGIPSLEADTPMFWVVQNDYKDPGVIGSDFSNGIAFGLQKTHPEDSYAATTPYNTSGNYNYGTQFAKMGISNRFFDFKIKGADIGTITVENSYANLILGSPTVTPLKSDVHDFSTQLNSDTYTEINVSDSVVFDIQQTNAGLISKADFTYAESKRDYTPEGVGELRTNTSRSFFTPDAPYYSGGGANEIVLMNTTVLEKNTTGGAIDLDKVENKYDSTDELNSSNWKYPNKIGQTIINVPVYNIGGVSNANLHVTYEGLGFDQSLISYSTDASTGDGSGDSINPVGVSSLNALLPNNVSLENQFGYDITAPLVNGEVPMSRTIHHPGFFKNGGKISNTFDETHKMMPTGSADFYGTIRIREQGETNGSFKDGHIAVNAKDGVVKWEDPANVLADVASVPTGSVIMFSEMSSDKFSFYAYSPQKAGWTGANALSYLPGSTAICAAFVGKGSGDLKNYYICNGAVLADTKDCWITGPFSKMEGINSQLDGGAQRLNPSGTLTDFDYENNPSFEQLSGAPFTDSDWTLDGVDARPTLVTEANAKIIGGSRQYGYSLPAPNTIESGFRVVLPNYFGRLPKMVFPESQFLQTLINGYDEINPEVGPKGYNPWSYYTPDGEYNTRYALSSSFDDLGSPYINKLHMPDTLHYHIQRQNTTSAPSGGDLVDLRGSVSTTGAASGSGAIGFVGTLAASSGSHTHEASPSYVNSYQETAFQDTAPTNNYPNLTFYDNNDSTTFMSNYKVGGQRFIEPPFKGTYMAINLKGLKNPLRNDEVIEDLHYIAGIPVCSGSGGSDDMAWWSDGDSNSVKYFDTPSWYPVFGGIGYPMETRHFEYRFKGMYRNDNTMHPYTYYDVGNTAFTGPLQNTAGSDTTLNYLGQINRTSSYST